MTATAGRPHKAEENRRILINFVLDKSGSMDVIRDATISGFNEFKNDQAKEAGEAFFTLTLFDTELSTVAAAVPVREVPDLDAMSYDPGGCTALYDAIGHTMQLTDDFFAANKPDQVLFVIMTDGMENASREFGRDRIFDMIRDRQKLAGYEFIYLGANQDSYLVGHQMGLRDGRMLDYAASPEVARETMRRASHNVSAYRRRGNVQEAQFFSQQMEDLGSMPVQEWAELSDQEKARHRED
ncbi:MAG: vWA domain-containing protein [Actinomycetota bacterium]|nr:vWA domain-containing protein [Actinomycetota bacterium]MDZ4181127.1 vWA domain-containing protein [Coriobacteriia bacterium]